MNPPREIYQRIHKKFLWEHQVKKDRVMSYWPLIHPLLLTIIRTLIGLYCFCIIIYGLDQDPGYWFIYFTDLTFILLTSYFLIQGFTGIYFQFLSQEKKELFLEAPSNGFDKFVWVLFEVVIPSACFLTTVYWTLLFTGDLSIDNFSIHALNSVWALTELMLTRFDIIAIHYLFPFLYLLLYTFWAWIYYARFNLWIYPFLSWSVGPVAAAYYLGVLILSIIFYFILKGICELRNWILRKKGFREKKSDEIEMETKSPA